MKSKENAGRDADRPALSPKIQWKGGALLAPVPPVIVSCQSGDEVNLITVAWTGLTCTQPPKTYISVRPERHSYHIIKESGEFVINLTGESLLRAADYCGMYTGKKVNKFEACHLTPVPGFEVSCPVIGEAPLSLECRVTDLIPLGSHDMFLADIVAVDVCEDLLDENGRLRLDRASLVAFAHGEYYALGRRLNTFGFSAKKKHHAAGAKKTGKPSSKKRT